MQESTGIGGTQTEPQITVYTAITGGKDAPRDDILCFTDYAEFVTPVRNAKIYKILSHQYVDSEISIWIDGNIFLNVSPTTLVGEYLGDADMALFLHFHRDCIYDEAPAAAGLYENDAIKKTIFDHAERYRKLGFPKRAGMAECNFIIRRNNARVRRFNETWWSEICANSFRDQISFPYALSLNKDLRTRFHRGNVREHPYFTYIPHGHSNTP